MDDYHLYFSTFVNDLSIYAPDKDIKLPRSSVYFVRSVVIRSHYFLIFPE